jgi:hypothetical protein
VRLVAQRVVRLPSASSSGVGGVNAFCWLHGDRFWLDVPPDDIGPGDLAGSIVEVPIGGNRVRSFLEIVAPDSTPARQIIAAVGGGAEFLADIARELPWKLSHGEVTFEFSIEAGMVATWQLELRILLGYALAARSNSGLGSDEPPGWDGGISEDGGT